MSEEGGCISPITPAAWTSAPTSSCDACGGKTLSNSKDTSLPLCRRCRTASSSASKVTALAASAPSPSSFVMGRTRPKTRMFPWRRRGMQGWCQPHHILLPPPSSSNAGQAERCRPMQPITNPSILEDLMVLGCSGVVLPCSFSGTRSPVMGHTPLRRTSSLWHFLRSCSSRRYLRSSSRLVLCTSSMAWLICGGRRPAVQ